MHQIKYLMRLVGSRFDATCFKILRSVILALAIALWLAAPVAAHSPYLEGEREVELGSGKRGHIALLFGDGIFFADPARAVIWDGSGAGLAATPESKIFNLDCRPGDPVESCSVLDRETLMIYVPNTAKFTAGGVLMENNKPTEYPYALSWEGFDLLIPLDPRYWIRVAYAPQLMGQFMGLLAMVVGVVVGVPLLFYYALKTYFSSKIARNGYIALFSIFAIVGVYATLVVLFIGDLYSLLEMAIAAAICLSFHVAILRRTAAT